MLGYIVFDAVVLLFVVGLLAVTHPGQGRQGGLP